MQIANSQPKRSPLLSRFDQDPGPWRPMYYPVEIDVPVTAGQSAFGSVTINNQPFILQQITHQIIGDTCDWEATGLCQDGQYDIELSDDQSNYQSGPIPAGANLGGPGMGFSLLLTFPIPYAGAKTLNARVTNRVTRILVPSADTFLVKITFCGIADWGELRNMR